MAPDVEGFEAAINAATERALDKYRTGVEQILQESLTAFERRIGQIMQHQLRHEPP